MDFYKIKTQQVKRQGEPVVEVYPDFIVGRSTDLMVQGKSFHAVWDEQAGLWSKDEYDVQRLVDQDLRRYVDDHPTLYNQGNVSIKLLSDFSSNSWRNFRNYLSNISDSVKPLDETITFQNTEVTKEDYVSKRVPYPLQKGDAPSYHELMDVLYDPEERQKLEWAVGAVLAGEAKYIQKFIVLYGEAGAGKSTFLNIVQELFEGYYTTFEAKSLVGSSNNFATEVFRDNPLVAIQHDGDLSRIEDNTKLNSIVSHEEMTMNEKFKPGYTARINAFLFMGTNKPVKVTDAKSGIIRRLIDVRPSGRRLPPVRYQVLTSHIKFELGHIAQHCLDVFLGMGRDYYASYRPVEMILQTDVFFNFVEYYFEQFVENDGISLKRAYDLYKVYCEDSNIEYKLPRHKFREELKNYFEFFYDRKRVGDQEVRSYYEGFLTDKFLIRNDILEPGLSLVLDSDTSLLDDELASCPAQYATQSGTPARRWAEVNTTIEDIDTKKLHFVQVPENHIVIDFDLVDEDGNKSRQKNLEAASKWPPTYAEYSKSGNGVHLHYIYEGDPTELASVYGEGIEIKVYTGNSSLRRKLTGCNTIPLAKISSGLPIKEKKMSTANKMTSERGVRQLIIRNLKKEIHPGTRPSIDFIYKILTDAKESGIQYDLRDMRGDILSFAMNSTNQAPYCINLVSKMPFYSTDNPVTEFDEVDVVIEKVDKDEIVYFDLEVYPNLFYISWKFAGADREMVHMFNPTPEEVEELLKMKLVGFNNRKYDNHILYARYMGYNNEQLYELSQKIINSKDNSGTFAAAYGLSYADVYDYTSEKKSLKKWEIDLGLKHMELDLPWDEPVPESKWPLVAEYCDTDVLATEAVANARKQDFAIRKLLADLSGLTVNDTNRAHTARIIFGKDKNAKKQFVYTDLSEEFPGYNYSFGESTYKGVITGEGGYVYAEPGMYENVVVLDVASMHPSSIEALNLFGPYTEKYSELKQARLAVKRKDYKKAETYLDGAFKPYLKDEKDAKGLSEALKIVINSVYGLTSASFDNPFRDIRNKDNIVAKRGALFMVELQKALEEKGVQVIHIKTDSIKLSNASPEIIDFVVGMGREYGYDFEVEDTYSKFCLTNKSVYIAKESPSLEHPQGKWVAVGAQFAHPYVFKTLFTHEEIDFDDLCETKQVKTSLYLDMNEGEDDDDVHNYHFVGRVGIFCPVRKGSGGGILLRLSKDDTYHAVTGTKGFRWMEANMVRELNIEDDIDMDYFNKLCEDAIKEIDEYGPFEWFVS